MTLREQIDIERLPKHIAIIMDGNGRWAKEHGRPRLFGHQNGVRSVREINEACANLGISYLTLYTFSTENWRRPADEVSGLMTLLGQTLKNEASTLKKNNIKMVATGDLQCMPPVNYQQVQSVIDYTKDCTGMVLNIALSYSGRWDITQAARRIAAEAAAGRLRPDDIDESTFGSFLATAGMPDPELLIRTSGELRISNFLLWQLAYSEMYFTDKYWPDFKSDDLYQAIIDYQHRERRFGKTSEQIK